MTSEILDNYNKKLEEQDSVHKFGGAHTFEQVDQQFLYKAILGINLACLNAIITNLSINTSIKSYKPKKEKNEIEGK